MKAGEVEDPRLFLTDAQNVESTGLQAVYETSVTLRDAFAMAAMSSLLRAPTGMSYVAIAVNAYTCADAMLWERQKRIDLVRQRQQPDEVEP